MAGEHRRRGEDLWFSSPGWVEIAPVFVRRSGAQVAIDAIVVRGGGVKEPLGEGTPVAVALARGPADERMWHDLGDALAEGARVQLLGDDAGLLIVVRSEAGHSWFLEAALP